MIYGKKGQNSTVSDIPDIEYGIQNFFCNAYGANEP